jgi:hypothetical protein
VGEGNAEFGMKNEERFPHFLAFPSGEGGPSEGWWMRVIFGFLLCSMSEKRPPV